MTGGTLARERPLDWTLAVYAGLALGILAAVVPMVQAMLASGLNPSTDFDTLHASAVRFWQTGTPYAPKQLAGPFTVTADTFIYPPTTLYVVAPFAFLPAILWWVIPLAVVGWFVATDRPVPWTWPILALCVVWPRTLNAVIVGGSDMWVTAGIALALHRSWASPLVPLLKPSVAPLALIGIRHRDWWRGAVVGIVAAAVMLPLWFQWLTMLGNLPPGGPFGVAYSLPSLPMYAIPVLAYVSRAGAGTRRATAP